MRITKRESRQVIVFYPSHPLLTVENFASSWCLPKSINEVITSVASIISTTFTFIYYVDRPPSGAKEFIP